jgi:hypothetical protein
MSYDNNDNEAVDKLLTAMESAIPTADIDEYPSEAVPLGTYARTRRHDRLGVIVDGFYGELDKNGTRVIIYTILLLPKNQSIIGISKNDTNYYLTNEYEYDITCYLMIRPYNTKNLNQYLGEGPLL